MSDLDSLIDTLVSDAQLATGTPAEWLLARDMVVRPTTQIDAGMPLGWTDEEDQFYLDHLADMTLEEIAAALGRSANAVKVHRFRKGLPSHRRTPGYLTTHQIAVLLGVDSHKPPVWVDQGILPGELVPFEGEVMRRVKILEFKMWLVRPTSWIYFKADLIKNESMRRLVQLAQERWGDEWWSTKQAGEFLGGTADDIDRQIDNGKIQGIQAKVLGGRNLGQRWAYWFVRKSDVMKLKLKKKGTPGESWEWKNISPRADAFILRARGEGKWWEEVARLMKWSQKRVEYRGQILKKRGWRSWNQAPMAGKECQVMDVEGNVWNAVWVGTEWLVMVDPEEDKACGVIVGWREQ